VAATSTSTPAPVRAPGISRGLVLLLAFACGATVANLYYAQPLLDTIAAHLHTSVGTAGFLVTASQLGYAAGLLLIVPLGDLLERRKLVTRMLVVTTLALVAATLAPSVMVLALAIAVAGITSVVAQILVPFASDLADDEDRGRVVGTVMSGLLTGILLARTVSGLIAEVAGWRTVFGIAAVLMLALSVLLHRMLPVVAPKVSTPYRSLLASIGTLVRTEPLLRRRMLYGMCGMATFSVLWTSLTFLLSRAPFHYSDAVIGLFGIAGLCGAVAAQGAGRLFDRGVANVATGAFWLAVVVGWLLCAIAKESVVALIVGLVLADAGIQGQHILNQSTIFGLLPEARSRLNTAYMAGNFVAGAIGSAAASVVWASGGWGGVCVLGGAFTLVGLGSWVQEQVVRPRPARA
jgi:predicted MFS family arabinose efflux permease